MRNKRNIMKRIASFLIVLMCMMTSTITVKADNDEIKKFVSENAPVYTPEGGIARKGSSKWTSKVSEYFSTTPDSVDMGIASAGEGVNLTTYYYRMIDESYIVAEINNVMDAEQINQQIQDITNGLNLRADTESATETVKGAVPLVNWALGLIVLVVTMLLALYTGSDILYLAFPVFRTKCEADLREGNTGMNVKKGSNGQCQYRFISDEAVRAYNKSVIEGGGKQPYISYAISRSWAYISLALLMTILLTGNASIFLEIGVKLGRGLIDIIQNF